MSWQFLLAVHLLFSTIFALVYRRMASRLNGFGRIVTAVMYIGVMTPGGIVTALLVGDVSFALSPLTWALIGLGGLFFVGFNILAYRANEELDAAQFAIISNLQALFVIIIAGIFLGERLNGLQLLGALLLIIASMDVAVEKIGVRTLRLRSASLIALGSSLCFAAAMTTEKALLSQMTFSTYIVITWVFQSIVLGWLSFKDRRKLKHITRRQLLGMLTLGGLRLGAGLTGVAAVRLVDVSIVASVRSYKPILIFIAAIIFLSEKRDFWRRAAGAIVATIGLILLV